jgi:hypothetical protein
MRKAIVIALGLMLLIAALASAGNNTEAKVAVHVRGHNAKAGCYPGRSILYCGDIITTTPFASVDAFPVFFDITEFRGCEYGLCWPAWEYSADFRSCSDLVIGGIMWPGDGGSHTWFSCHEEVCIPSYVWLYADAPGMVCPCPHPVSGAISVLDCAEGLDGPACVFCAGVYGNTGDDPCACGPVGTETVTWGGIKGMFE